MIVSITPAKPITKIAFPIKLPAFFISLRPAARLKEEAPPIPIRRAMAIQEVFNGNAMFVAALPSSPMALPIKY